MQFFKGEGILMTLLNLIIDFLVLLIIYKIIEWIALLIGIPPVIIQLFAIILFIIFIIDLIRFLMGSYR